MPKKGPKSYKADGTPKRRWSSSERSERGRPTRRSGGKPRSERTWDNDRPGTGRPQRRTYRDDARDTRDDPRRDDRPNPRRDDRFVSRRDNRDGERRNFRDDSRSNSRDDSRRSYNDAPRRPYRNDGRSDFRRDDRGDRRNFRDDDRRGFRDDNRRSSRDDNRGSFRRDDRPDTRGNFRDDDRRPYREDNRRSFRDDDRRDSRNFRDENRSGRRDWEDRGPRRDSRRDFEPRRDFAGRGPRGSRGAAPEFQRGPRKGHRNDHYESAPETDHMSWESAEEVTEAPELVGTSGFSDLGVDARIVATLAGRGITAPFPIQEATIADAIAGRDVLGRGRTGSGKTLAFGLPLLTRLAGQPSVGAPRAVILSPTRELAMQIADELSPLASSVGLHLTLVAGGMSYGPQLKAFERGVDVVVATPGRLIDLLEQGAADLSQVGIAVLDEADHMSDLGFLPEVTTLLDAVEEGGQRLLFSATLDGAVGKIVKRYLTEPVTHEVDENRASITTMTHHLLQLPPHYKNAVTAEIANREGKTVIFARTQAGTDRIAGQLREAGVLAGALHGGLTQGARARILAAFKGGDVPVLVATDVAARGIHVDDVSLVLQVDPPMGPKDYLHRAGRTARAGESGAVVSIVLPHQRKMMNRITGQAGVNGSTIPVEPGSADLRDTTGARPVSGTPIDDADYQAIIAPRQPKGNRYGRRNNHSRPYRSRKPRR